MRGSISWLLAPHDRRTFAARYFQRAPLHVSREPDAHAGLVSVADVDDALARLWLEESQVRMARDGRILPAEEYTLDGALVDPALVVERFRSGATLVVDGAERWHRPIAELCRTLAGEIHGRAWANLYLTPAGAAGFAPHADTHDVFVLQIEGTKRWSLYAPPGDVAAECEAAPAGHDFGPPVRTLKLAPGDVLYIPRGHPHSAASEERYTFHVTVGFRAPSWADLVAAAAQELARRDARLRVAPAPGAGGAGSARARRAFREVLDVLARDGSLDDALARLAGEDVRGAKPIVPGQLLDAVRVPALRLTSQVGPRAALRWHLSRRGDRVTLVLPGRDLELPGHAERAVRHALTHARFRPRELPGLDDEGRLTLVRRLLREGALRRLER